MGGCIRKLCYPNSHFDARARGCLPRGPLHTCLHHPDLKALPFGCTRQCPICVGVPWTTAVVHVFALKDNQLQGHTQCALHFQRPIRTFRYNSIYQTKWLATCL